MLAERSASPVQLAAKLDASLGTVAYHVRTLHGLGLVELVDTRQRRGATGHYYRARAHPRFSDAAWAGLAAVDKQRMLSAMLQQVGQFASASAAAGGFDRTESRITRSSMRLDERGWAALAEATTRWQAEADAIEEEARARLGDDPGGDGHGNGRPALDVGLVLMFFEAARFSDHPPAASGSRDRRGRGSRP